MIIAQGLTKIYGETKAVDDVTFEAQKGEILGFLGPNAAGKTTTMRILTGYFPPQKGYAKVAGYDIVEQSAEARKRIGYLPENLPLYTDFPVDVYLDFVAQVKGVGSRERPNEVNRLIGMTNLESVRKKMIGKLSRGYRQRVGLAQALAGDPEVLILDEPTTGLDPQQRVDFRNLIQSFAEKKTVILSTHILAEAQSVCQRVIIINHGKIIAVDTPENLFSRLRQMDVIFAEIEGPPDEVTLGLEEFPGVLGVQRNEIKDQLYSYRLEAKSGLDLRKDLAAFIVGKGWNFYELRPMEVNLEEVYIELMAESAKDAQGKAEPQADQKSETREEEE